MQTPCYSICKVLIKILSRRLGCESRQLGNGVPFLPNALFSREVGGLILEVAGLLAGCWHLMRALIQELFFTSDAGLIKFSTKFATLVQW